MGEYLHAVECSGNRAKLRLSRRQPLGSGAEGGGLRAPPAAGLRIRRAVAGDAATIVALVRELADFEGLRDEVRITEADVLRDGFGPEPAFGCLIAEVEGEPVGFVLYFPTYSTFSGRAGAYIEDLYVRESLRQLGIGRALLAHVARRAAGGRLELAVLDWNPARRFYEQLGFVPLDTWLRCRLAGGALEALAAEAGREDAG